MRVGVEMERFRDKDTSILQTAASTFLQINFCRDKGGETKFVSKIEYKGKQNIKIKGGGT